MKDKKHILVVCQHFWPENFLINDICAYLVKEKNCQVDVLCGIPNYPQGKIYPGYGLTKNRHQTHKGATINRTLEIPRGNNTYFRIFINYISFPIFSLFHIPSLLRQRYDAVFIYQLSPILMAITGIIVGKLKKIPITMYVLDLWPEDLYSVLKVKSKFLRFIALSTSTWFYRQANRLIALTPKMAKVLAKRTNRPLSEIAIIPQAAEAIYETKSSSTTVRQQFSDTFNLVFAGNISPAQSFATMIKAAKILWHQGLSQIRWIIAGDGMSRRSVENEVKQQQLDDVFVFVGYKQPTEVLHYLDVADVLIGCLAKSPLLSTALPAKVITYLASGKPIALAMDGEPQDLINNIGCGFATPAEDPQALAKSIKKLYQLNASQRTQLGEKAKNYFQKNLRQGLLYNQLYEVICK